MADFIKRTRRKTNKGQYTTFTTNIGTGKTTRSYSTKMGGWTVTTTRNSNGSEKRTEYIKCGATGAVKRTTKTYNPPKAKSSRSSSRTRRRSTSQNQGCAVFIPIFFLMGLTPFLIQHLI